MQIQRGMGLTRKTLYGRITIGAKRDNAQQENKNWIPAYAGMTKEN
jgi:hypothetical protein